MPRLLSGAGRGGVREPAAEALGNSLHKGMEELPLVQGGQEQQSPPVRVRLVMEPFSTWEFDAPSPLAFEKLLHACCIWLPSAPLPCKQRYARAQGFCNESAIGLYQQKKHLENILRSLSLRCVHETKPGCGAGPLLQ